MVKQVDNTPPDPREAELVEEMTLDVQEYIFSEATMTKIQELMAKSTNTSQTMATIAYKAVRSAAEKRKASAQIEMDMDMMMGVSTAAIDMMTEVAEVTGQVMQGANVDTLKEDTLLRLTVIHGEQLERTPEQKEQAMTDLRSYMSDTGAQKAFDYVNKRAAAEGLNPMDMERQGNEMFYGSMEPTKDALKSSIKQGLMDQSPMNPRNQTPEAMASRAGIPRTGPPIPPIPPPPSPETLQRMQEVGYQMGEPEGLMGRSPPNMPDPLPAGPGIAQPAGEFPPQPDPNAELAPPPERIQ